MIGNCDACDRKNVPVSKVNVPGEPVACFICQGEADPDPYCETIATPLEAAKKLLVGASVGSCTCHTKTPELMWHEPSCRYVMIMMALENVEVAASADAHSAP